MKNFFEELKRRNVIKAAIAYVVVAWVVLQVISILAPLFEVPSGVTKFITVLLFIGFPIWIVFSWVYEATTEGVKRTSEVQPGESMSHVINKRLNILIVVMLVVAVAVNLLMGTPVLNKADNQSEEPSRNTAIVVLPFDDESPGEDSEWFSKAMTTDVQSNLALLSELNVISNTSAARYKSSEKSVPEIMQELGVNYVLEGNVSIHDGYMRINVQLIDSNDHPVWNEVFREEFKEVHHIQERISRAIAEKLKVAISTEEDRELVKLPTSSLQAYELVNRAVMLLDRGNREDEKTVKELLNRAIALDSGYADVYALKAWVLLNDVWEYGGETETLGKIDSLTRKSLELDPQNMHALILKSDLSYRELNYEQTEYWLEKALAIHPNQPLINEIAYYLYTSPFAPDTLRAYQHMEKAHKLDPYSPSINRTYYYYLNQKGDYDAAYDHLKTHDLGWDEDEHWWANTWWTGVAENDPTYAGKALIEQLEKDPGNAKWHQQIARYYDGVFNDNENYVKYAKSAYALDKKNLGILSEYIQALAEYGAYEKALSILDTLDISRYERNALEVNRMRSNVLYQQGKYEDALKELEEFSKVSRTSAKFWTLAQLKDKAAIDEFINDYRLELNQNDWAFYYAIQGNRDSMYFYLDHPKIFAELVNSRFEFDPYRNDERYKDFLRKHGFPIPGEYNPSELEIKQPRTIEVEGQ
ncbi:hypothetical protein E7Z59_00265 [Robertkochia marina]|uniref:Tetratricopeptide repeat protein n=1 Tax=Robertkochia marina TaxID=1227945 RepID=A0A4S3M3T3_9FLAO|nr:hypothetical protein [Robertkochia marina]THD68797.1 hypothetical protein E7Z59_00265 [Robertkochia marina]TRZ43871.1 hypothetical protein D3A96_09920 [Robertkochia marina]